MKKHAVLTEHISNKITLWLQDHTGHYRTYHGLLYSAFVEPRKLSLAWENEERRPALALAIKEHKKRTIRPFMVRYNQPGMIFSGYKDIAVDKNIDNPTKEAIKQANDHPIWTTLFLRTTNNEDK